MDAAKYVVKYLASTKTLGISFTSMKRSLLESFLCFPVPSQVLSMSDANWGPQDATRSKTISELPPFASRSMSGFFIDLLGPIHWSSKCQTVTAGSSAEAEIYATDDCVKFLLELVQILEFLQVKDLLCPRLISSIMITKLASIGPKLPQLRDSENRVRENIATNFVKICHVDGKLNIADIFTKEMKDTNHFVTLRNLFMCSRNQF
jgi:hypothetical protein